MSTTISVIILLEVLFGLFIAWGIMHEERFVAFEDKIIFAVLRKIRAAKSSREAARREKINEKVLYTPVRPTTSGNIKRDHAA